MPILPMILAISSAIVAPGQAEPAKTPPPFSARTGVVGKPAVALDEAIRATTPVERADRIEAKPVPLVKPKPKLKMSVKPIRIPTARERMVAACKAAKGAWNVEIKGVHLSARGSDVDEIYGRIYATTTSGGTLRPSRRAPGWEPANLWESDKNQNLGKYPVTVFPRLYILDLWGAERHRAKIRIHFNLRDEDDARGGSNDEFFSAYGPSGYYKGPDNSVEFPFLIPDCDEQPEFTAGADYFVMGAPLGQGEKNVVKFRVAIHASRKY